MELKDALMLGIPAVLLMIAVNIFEDYILITGLILLGLGIYYSITAIIYSEEGLLVATAFVMLIGLLITITGIKILKKGKGEK